MSPPLHPELLLSHAGSLRTMARALLRDEHAADDVVQETWLRALVAPPAAAEGGVGGWLRSVAQGFAQQHRRAEGRRERRERLYAAERCEALDADQRGAVLRAVMEAVLALDEPYRETVLLRWFEGLPPRAIAARQGVAVATVDSRLQRAHARLRVRLERELGGGSRGWRGLVALALGAPDAAAVPTLVIPLIGVVVSLKLVGAALAAVVGVCLWVGWDRTRPPSVEPTDVAIAAAPVGERPTLSGAPNEDARALVAGAEPASVAAEPVHSERAAALPPGPFTFALQVDVVDADERPIHGAEVFLGPASCSPVRLGETSWDGRLVREWRGFEPSLEGVLYVRTGGRQTSLRRVQLASGTRHVLRFQSDPTGGELLVIGMMSSRVDRVRFEAKLVETKVDAFELDAAGNGIFRDSQLAHAVEPESPEAGENLVVVPAAILRADAVTAELAITGRALTLLDRKAAGTPLPSTPAEAPPRATVRGVVRDERGRPLTDLVVAGRTPERWNTGVVCNQDGEFVFKDVPPGPMEVCVGGGERIFVREVLELAPGESRFLELRPVMRTRLHVRLQDSTAKPLAQWRIEARGADGLLLGVAETDEHGAAVLGLDGEGQLQLFARPLDQHGVPAISVGQCTSARTDELTLVLPVEMRSGSVALSVAETPTAARAWRVDSGEGQMLPTGDASSAQAGTLFSGRLLPGRWRIELTAPGRAWTTMAEFDLAPGEKLDLGRLMLPPTASVDLSSGESKEPVQLSLRAHVDGAVVVWPDRSVLLPVTLETLPDVRIDVLRCPAREGEGTATTPLDEPLRLRGGRSQAVALPVPRSAG